ncbi:MAG: SMP-30/gluconolactonase/LRE family protein [Planctomycetota bacterium]
MRLLLALPLLSSCAAPAERAEPQPAPRGELTRLATGMQFTEGPVWLPDEGALVFSDIPRGELLRWTPAGGVELLRRCANPNGNARSRDGQLLTCLHGDRRLVRWEEDGSQHVLAERFGGKRLNSPNDLAVGTDGTLWFTDPPWGLAGQSEGKELGGHWVFRRDPDGGLAVVLHDRAMPNGIALSPDETRLYVADTGGHRSHPDPNVRGVPASVSAWAIDGGNELAAEPLWSVQTRCDGMCVDERGFLYTTAKTGITILSPTGEVVVTIDVPEQPANVCFGGKDGRTLFITARTSLYAVDMSVAGHLTR